MSEETVPRVENGAFIWKCDHGHVTDTPLDLLAASAVSDEKTVCVCHKTGCDRVFEISKQFENDLIQSVK